MYDGEIRKVLFHWQRENGDEYEMGKIAFALGVPVDFVRAVIAGVVYGAKNKEEIERIMKIRGV